MQEKDIKRTTLTHRVVVELWEAGFSSARTTGPDDRVSLTTRDLRHLFLDIGRKELREALLEPYSIEESRKKER